MWEHENKQREHSVPKLALRTLRRYCPGRLLEGVEGDLEEFFAERSVQYGRYIAAMFYWKEVLLVCAWHGRRDKPAYQQARGFVMWKNYLTVARRNLLKNKGFSAINILGLTVGMACCMLLLLYVQDELSYDQHHEERDRIYRYVFMNWAATAPATGPALMEEYGHLLESYVRVLPQSVEEPVAYRDQQFMESRVIYADSTFLDVFTHTMLRGNAATALDNPNSMVITSSTAQKYFGDANPLGETLTMRFWGQSFSFEVTGIIADLPETSHFTFDFLGSLATFRQPFAGAMQSTGWAGMYTYVLLEPGTTQQQFEAILPDYLSSRNFPAGLTARLQPLTDIRFDPSLEKDYGPRTNSSYVYLLLVIAGFVLVVACVNFMNLTTARAADRAKEVGMRKTLGAQQGQLVRQFLTESIGLSLIALLLACVVVVVALPTFNGITGKALQIDVIRNLPMLGVFVLLALGVGLSGGLYPAFVLARFRPITALRNNAGASAASTRLRKALVVGQFAISVFLIIGATVVFQQLNYMQNKDLGFDKDQVVMIQTNNYPVVKEALTQLSGVRHVSGSQHVPGERIGIYPVRLEGMPQDTTVLMRAMSVDFDYFTTMGISVNEGRSFAEDMGNDAAGAFVLNEAAMRAWRAGFGIDEAVGKDFEWFWGQERTGKVIGIVEDFHYASLHTAVEPLVLYVAPAHRSALVRLQQGRIQETLRAIEAEWGMLSPDMPFNVSFLDSRMDALYRAEQRLSSVFGMFTAIAIVIACLGLFGLATFTAEKRKKEMGVRKVLGASQVSLVVLLSREFAWLVGIAIVVAVPVAYMAVNRWLSDFAYQVEIGPGIYILSALAALGIALLTVSYQAIRAARANPVSVIRTE